MSIVRGHTSAANGDRFLREVACARKAFDALESKTEGRALSSEEVKLRETGNQISCTSCRLFCVPLFFLVGYLNVRFMACDLPLRIGLPQLQEQKFG